MNTIKKLVAALLACLLFLAPGSAYAQDLGRAVQSLDLRVMALEQAAGSPSPTLEAIRADLAAIRACACNTQVTVDAAQLRMTRIESSLMRLGRFEGEIRKAVDAIDLTLKDHERQLAALRDADVVHDQRLAAHDEAIGGLQDGQRVLADDVLALTERVDGIEDRERAWREGLVIGGSLVYGAGVGGQVTDYGIFYDDETRYATNRVTWSPYLGIVAEYREKLYTDFNAGFVFDATNTGGIGFELRGHLGALLADRKLALGGGAFIRWTKAGGGKGGTFDVISTDPGVSIFAKYAVWRSKQQGAQINLGAEVGLAGITQSVLTDRLSGTTMEVRGFLELRLGKQLPPPRD